MTRLLPSDGSERTFPAKTTAPHRYDAFLSYSRSDEVAAKSVLVTGGLGFIGSHVARRLVDLGAQVAVVDSLFPAYGGNPINVEDVRERISVTVADV